MASANQIVFDFIGNDNVSNVIDGISSRIDGMSTSTYMALQDIGQKAQEISNDIVQSASDAQQAWIAFANGLSNVGGGDLASAKKKYLH